MTAPQITPARSWPEKFLLADWFDWLVVATSMILLAAIVAGCVLISLALIVSFAFSKLI